MSRVLERGVGWARRTEAPTWALVAAIYGGWLALTWFWHALPVWGAVALGGWLCAWHMSLQHELIHFHPTRSDRINELVAAPPLNLWLPYRIYRDEHRRHHRDAHLTDPLEDPESTYVLPETWDRSGSFARVFHRLVNTGLGRILLGPPHAVALFWRRRAPLVGRTVPWRDVLIHAASVALILVWVAGVCHVGIAAYVACVAYPGTALILIRSLAEHRAAERHEDRTAVVEKGGLLGLLFLYNNLHLLHHAQPGLPWYELPSRWRQSRDRLLEGRAGPIYAGYLDVALRYAVHPHHPGPHPNCGVS